MHGAGRCGWNGATQTRSKFENRSFKLTPYILFPSSDAHLQSKKNTWERITDEEVAVPGFFSNRFFATPFSPLVVREPL